MKSSNKTLRLFGLLIILAVTLCSGRLSAADPAKVEPPKQKELPLLSLNLSAGVGGSVSPSNLVSILLGGNQACTATPDPCYTVDKWLVDDVVSQTGGLVFNLLDILLGHTVKVTFKLIACPITVSAGANGSITEPSLLNLNCGDSPTFHCTPAPCYVVDHWLCDNSIVQTGGLSYVLSNTSTSHTVAAATFKLQTCLLTASASAGGTVSPIGDILKNCGDSQIYTATANPSFTVDTWLVDGSVVQTGGVTLTLNSIQTNRLIQVNFTCAFSLGVNAITCGSSGATTNLSLTAGLGCNWTAASNAGWISIVSSLTGTGPTLISLSIDSNDANCAARTGTVTIAGLTFTVIQAAGIGSFIMAPLNNNCGASSSSGSLTVTAGISCPWNAGSDVNWISITSSNGGTGNGSLVYTIASNDANCLSRTGTLHVAGSLFTIIQDAGIGGHSITPLNASCASVKVPELTVPSCPSQVGTSPMKIFRSGALA